MDFDTNEYPNIFVWNFWHKRIYEYIRIQKMILMFTRINIWIKNIRIYLSHSGVKLCEHNKYMKRWVWVCKTVQTYLKRPAIMDFSSHQSHQGDSHQLSSHTTVTSYPTFLWANSWVIHFLMEKPKMHQNCSLILLLSAFLQPKHVAHSCMHP